MASVAQSKDLYLGVPGPGPGTGPGPQPPTPGLAAGQSPFFSSLFRSAGRPAQSTSDRSRRGAITQRRESDICGRKTEIYQKAAEVNWNGKLAML